MAVYLRFAGTLVFTVVLWSGAVGCGCTDSPGRYDITISLDDSLLNKTTEVHILAVNAADDPSWRGYSMTEYWKALDPKISSYPHATILFTGGETTTKSFNQDTDEGGKRWSEWQQRGAVFLYILADLPGSFTDAPGDADPRRKILPLGQCNWEYLKDQKDKEKGIQIRLTSGGIEVQTPPKKGS